MRPANGPRVAIIPGDDAAPEAMAPTVEILRLLAPELQLNEMPPGEVGLSLHGSRESWITALQEAIDASDSTLFGATSGATPAHLHLRWGRGTFANVRPVRWRPGFRSPLREPEGIDYVIVRENLEDLYLGIEGPLRNLQALGPLHSPMTQGIVSCDEEGSFALKITTERRVREIADFACRLALKRLERGRPGRVTCASKFNLLRKTDGLFRDIVQEAVANHPELTFEACSIDAFTFKAVARPADLDVVVAPNLYGDIISDLAGGTLGSLGLCPSGCYGQDFAYFESIHGTAPDLVGLGVINPTSTMLAAAMMLEHLGSPEAAERLEAAIFRVYQKGRWLTPDQGGRATTKEFAAAVRDGL